MPYRIAGIGVQKKFGRCVFRFVAVVSNVEFGGRYRIERLSISFTKCKRYVIEGRSSETFSQSTLTGPDSLSLIAGKNAGSRHIP
jgi:hypothetical protein